MVDKLSVQEESIPDALSRWRELVPFRRSPPANRRLPSIRTTSGHAVKPYSLLIDSTLSTAVRRPLAGGRGIWSANTTWSARRLDLDCHGQPSSSPFIPVFNRTQRLPLPQSRPRRSRRDDAARISRRAAVVPPGHTKSSSAASSAAARSPPISDRGPALSGCGRAAHPTARCCSSPPPEACSPDHARPRRRRPGLLRLLAPPPDAGAPGSRDASAVPWRGGALEKVVLQPIREISGAVQLPGSKSLSNRILLLSALFEGTTVVDNLLNSEDVHYMLEALDALGLSVEADKVAKRAVVVGCGGRFPIEKDAKEEVKLFLGNAGTAMRPLTAAVVAAGGNATYVSVMFLMEYQE
nr:uncharacterized protein LOC127329646 [Lolium perenne]